MQVPEKLALIGGSILLSSTLIFTLKSQASSIIPSVGHSISHVFDHIGDAQKSSDFDSNLKQAQKEGETTGTWGTSKYYIDNNENMHVGKGNLQGDLNNMLGNDKASQIQSLNIDQRVQAPEDSTGLFSVAPLYGGNDNNLKAIKGLDNVDTSRVANIDSIFGGDVKLQSLEGINSWDVSNVRATAFAFHGVLSLKSLDLSNWNIHNVPDANHMFGNNTSLESLNIQRFDLTGANTNGFLGGMAGWSAIDNNLHQITLGNNIKLSNIGYPLDNQWQNGQQRLTGQQILDGNAHPGTWTKQ